jgi:molybdopterin converting factor small subunit
MQITFKLFATLTDYLPPDRAGNVVAIDLDEGATIGSVIAAYRLPEKLTHLVLVNGNYIAPADRATYRLKAGDTLAIWPPIAGG